MKTANSIPAQLPLCSSLPILVRSANPIKNEDVRYLQQVLNKKGYLVATDGMFGPKTEQAVIKFQKQQQILVDGIVGPQTWIALGACEVEVLGC
jgi:peptidoglycan hydrolase-like protein with peptidoglycan-binding domain